MAMYRKKPVVIEAVQVGPEIPRPGWFQEAVNRGDIYFEVRGPTYINTLEGVMRAEIGDWIIKGVKGEIYPCKPDIFAATYDPA